MRHAALFLAALALAGCGYVGDPLPPALNIPERVTNLQAVEHGAVIRVRFTAPAYSGEKLPLKRLRQVEVLAGTDVFRREAEPGAEVEYTFAAAPYVGREITVSVRTTGPTGRVSAPSNEVRLAVIPPLRTPAAWSAEGVKEGVRVQWSEVRGGRVYRQAEGEKEPRLLGQGEGAWVDESAEIGKTYVYRVQYTSGTAESELSEPRRFTYTDTFPPAVPSGLQAVAGVDTIELNWDRNAETDLRGYHVYRADEAGGFARIGDLAVTNAFRDAKLQSGKRYRYRVTAVDQAGNESEPCNPIEVQAP